MNRFFGSFLFFFLLILALFIIFPLLLIQKITSERAVQNMKASVDKRVDNYAIDFINSLRKECIKAENCLTFTRDFLLKDKIYNKEIIGSYFFDRSAYFCSISLLDQDGNSLFTLISNPDQTYLLPYGYEEFRDPPKIKIPANIKTKNNKELIPIGLMPIPGGYAQRILLSLGMNRFLLADINIDNIISNSVVLSYLSAGAFLLVFTGNDLIFNSSKEIGSDEIINLKEGIKSGDYKIGTKNYRIKEFAIDSLPTFFENLEPIKFIIGIDYTNMLGGINAGLNRGLFLITFFGILIGLIFILTGMYIKNETDIILKRTDEIATGEFDKRISVRFPLEFCQIAHNINELSIKLKNLTGDKVKSAKLSAIGRFAAHLVHDLRSPVYGLSLIVYELKKRINKDDPKLRYFDEIVEGIKKLGEIIDKIAEHGKIYEPQKGDVDLNRLIKEIADSFSKEFPCKITTQFADIGIIQIDPNQWRRVFLNLLQNAYEAKREDCQIMIKTYRLAGHPSVVIEIADKSGGIPQEMIDNIFEPFVTTKKKGIGLGLSYVKEIVEVHNGEIAVENSPGIGVKFIITLPVDIANGNE